MRNLTSLNSFRYVLPAAGLVALLAACADAPTAAPTPASLGKTTPNPTSATTVSYVGDTTVTTFPVRPDYQTTAEFGAHKIVFSANSICDPAQSTYGPTEWDAPCTLLKSTISITAKSWVDEDGHPQVDFQPALRFNPDDRKPVTLYLQDKDAVWALSAAIFFVDGNGTRVDEAALDPEVATQRDGTNGFLYRRVKHFSGYTVTVD